MDEVGSTVAARPAPALAFVALILVVVVTRVPFVGMRLAGEEGGNGRAVVMLAQGKLPRMVIARSAHGQEFVIPAGHNLGGYVLPAALAAPLLRLTGFKTIEQRAHAAQALRVAYLLLYCLTLAVALLLVPRERRVLGAVVLAALSLPTLPLLASVQVNYDGAVSALFVVVALACFEQAVRRRSLVWACAAAVPLGMGKAEYAIAVAVALLLSEAWARRLRLWPPFAVTLIGGMLVWRWLDPANFDYGFEAITRLWKLQGGNQAPIGARARAYAREHLALFWPLYGACLVALIGVVRLGLRRRPLASVLPVALSMVFIMAGYHAIAWPGDHFPRYLAPCFPIAALVLDRVEIPAALTLVLVSIVLAAGAVAYPGLLRERDRALSRIVRSTRDDLALARELEASPRPCITVTDMDSGVGFYSSRASFACCFAQWTPWPAEQGEALCR